MSMIIRSAAPLRAARALPQAVARQQVRLAHFENVVNHTIPTNVTNKPFLALKIAVFGITGFGIPIFGAWWQLKKASA